MPERRDRGRAEGTFRGTAARIKGLASDTGERVKEWGAGDWDILLVIVLLASALRIYFAIVSEETSLPGVIGPITGLADLARSGTMDTITPPLLPSIHFLITSIAGKAGTRGIFIFQAVLSSLSIIMIYGAGRCMFGRRTGLTAAAIAAIYPGFIFVNLKTGPDSLLLLLAVSITALAASRTGERSRSTWLAFLTGVSMMVSPVAAFFVPGSLLAARRRILFIVVLAATLLPWTVRNSTRMKRFVPVYDPPAYAVSLDKYHVARDGWRPVHRLYIDISYIFARSWDEDGEAGTTDPARRNSNHIAVWAYTLLIFSGTAGMIRHLGRRQLPAAIPMTAFIALLVFLTDFDMSRRILLVPLLMIFAAALFFARRDLKEEGPVRSRPLDDPVEEKEMFQPIP